MASLPPHRPHRPGLGVALAAGALGLAGCGAERRAEPVRAPAERVTVTVTRDFGAAELRRAGPLAGRAGEDVLGLLRRSLAVRERSGEVRSVDGTAAAGSTAWALHVNGVRAPPTGPGGGLLQSEDRIQLDLHDRSAAAGVAATVGAFPEPFRSGLGGKRLPVRIDCADEVRDACRQVGARLAAAGARPTSTLLGTAAGREVLRIIVGPFRSAAGDAAAAQLLDPPAVSGVFARFSPDGRRLALLDARGRTSRELGAGGGLVAATRYRDQQPTWLVTGTDAAGVRAAAGALDGRVLARRYAVAVAGGRPAPLPEPAR